MRDEIHAGLKIAIERGNSLEDAVQSFINAGYNPVEVKEAANSISSGAISVMTKKKEPPKSVFQQSNQTSGPAQPSQAIPQQSQQTQSPDSAAHSLKPLSEDSKKKKVIILVAVLIILIIALGLVIYFKQNLINFLKEFL